MLCRSYGSQLYVYWLSQSHKFVISTKFEVKLEFSCLTNFCKLTGSVLFSA